MSNYIGKVIRILDKYTLIINAGELSVSPGEKIQVYCTLDEIKDLDGSNLGEFVYVKDELEVMQVETNYSICKKNKYMNKKTPLPLALSPLLENNYVEKVPLIVNQNDLEPFPEIDKTIQIGDKVRSV